MRFWFQCYIQYLLWHWVALAFGVLTSRFRNYILGPLAGWEALIRAQTGREPQHPDKLLRLDNRNNTQNPEGEVVQKTRKKAHTRAKLATGRGYKMGYKETLYP